MSSAGDPEDHAKSQMVLGPFAETKGPRLPGRDPAKSFTLVSMSFTQVIQTHELEGRNLLEYIHAGQEFDD